MNACRFPDRVTGAGADSKHQKVRSTMTKTHAVGIDLGTTYSCLAYLNEHGEPVSLANQEGELSTPSVVLFDDGEVVVGTEALRNAILKPECVVQNSKRHMGDPSVRWTIDGRTYTAVDIAAFILKKLLDAATEQIGPVEHATITVPAQFSELQRDATVKAGLQAGLKRVDIINEPVAAALCHVLGTEGLWFTEIAKEQRILVYDLGGGTFDLSVVLYRPNEVKVIAGGGDLNLGGIDWNERLLKTVCENFVKEFGKDPREDPVSLQYLANEIENTKRSLTVRPRAALICQHAGHRKTYQIEQEQFVKLTKRLVDRTAALTDQLLRDNDMGWGHVDVILTTGGASRMPMIRAALKELGGRTLNTSLSPDLSIAHGATYYSGMLLTNDEYARSILSDEATRRLGKMRHSVVNARGLGLLVRQEGTKRRFPHFLIPANTALPASVTEIFGTVRPNQRRVHLHIVESGTAADERWVVLGNCVIDNLPPDLPEGSKIAVTIRYDEQARVHVSAEDLTSGRQATTEIIREENLVESSEADLPDDESTAWSSATIPVRPATASPHEGSPAATAPGQPGTDTGSDHRAAAQPAVSKRPDTPERVDRPSGPRAVPEPRRNELEQTVQAVPVCNRCGGKFGPSGECAACGASMDAGSPEVIAPPKRPIVESGSQRPQTDRPGVQRPSGGASEFDEDDILDELFRESSQGHSSSSKDRRGTASPRRGKRPPDSGEDDFWQLTD